MIGSSPVLNFPALNLPALNLPVLNFPALNLPVLNLPVLNFPALNLPVLNLPVLNLPVVEPLSDLRQFIKGRRIRPASAHRGLGEVNNRNGLHRWAAKALLTSSHVATQSASGRDKSDDGEANDLIEGL